MRITGLRLIAILCVLLLGTHEAAGNSDFGFLGEHDLLPFLKKISGFADWPGRTTTVRNGFKLSPDILPEEYNLLQKSEANPFFEGCIPVVSRTYRVTPPEKETTVKVRLIIAGDSFTAQEFMVRRYLTVTMTIRPNFFGRRRGSEHGLELGDITLVSAEDEGFSSVKWTRDNIFVRIQTENKEGYAFVGPLARAVDKAIQERKTFKEYFACSACPEIITGDEKTEMQKKNSFALSGKSGKIQARDPNGEALSCRNAEFAGIQIPIVINESNLLAVPPHFSWVRHMTQDAVKFYRLYHHWRKAKLSGKEQIASEKYRQMEKLGIAILPHVVQRGRPLIEVDEKKYKRMVQHFQDAHKTKGENNATDFPILSRLPDTARGDLLGLVRKITDGEIEVKGNTTREKLLSVTEWWWDNQEIWYRKIADHYQTESVNRK